ncbi:Rieske (2Fe-2S) protein [Kribbella deserti]|uniref:Cytochrome bc1 complex Rieske iron-sulfur subunit n=1 Tax=Kribbella deserti TaxID=1926257 RepID=A0ABV6QKV2_9ACTN
MSKNNSEEPIAGVVRDRRTVLRGAAVAGIAGVSGSLLVACGDDGAPSAGPSTAPSSGPATTPTTAPSSAPSATASTGGGGAVLGPVGDVPVGGGKIFPDQKLVVTQPTAGQFKGFSAVCTHAGCVVESVADGSIVCGCHGSKFKVADGSVTTGPATSPLASVAVTVENGNILGPAS